MAQKRKIILFIILMAIIIVVSKIVFFELFKTRGDRDHQAIKSFIVINNNKITGLKGKSCDELIKLYESESKKLDWSCEIDNDCVSAMRNCSCQSKNTKDEIINEIYNQEIIKFCVPQLECQQFICQCVNNECISRLNINQQIAPSAQSTKTSKNQLLTKLCAEKYSDCSVYSIQECRDGDNQKVYQLEYGCTDLPHKYVDEQEKLLEICEGMPLPSGNNECQLDVSCSENDQKYLCENFNK